MADFSVAETGFLKDCDMFARMGGWLVAVSVAMKVDASVLYLAAWMVFSKADMMVDFLVAMTDFCMASKRAVRMVV